MTPERARCAQHILIVVPGEAGDPLAGPRIKVIADGSQAVFRFLQQGDLRVDTRLSAGMTRCVWPGEAGYRACMLDEPHAPIVYAHEQGLERAINDTGVIFLGDGIGMA